MHSKNAAGSWEPFCLHNRKPAPQYKQKTVLSFVNLTTRINSAEYSKKKGAYNVQGQKTKVRKIC